MEHILFNIFVFMVVGKWIKYTLNTKNRQLFVGTRTRTLVVHVITVFRRYFLEFLLFKEMPVRTNGDCPMQLRDDLLREEE